MSLSQPQRTTITVPEMAERLLSVGELAEWLQVSEAWVRKHAAAKCRPVIPCVRLGKMMRFKESEINAWLKGLQKGREAA